MDTVKCPAYASGTALICPVCNSEVPDVCTYGAEPVMPKAVEVAQPPEAVTVAPVVVAKPSGKTK